ncbi:MAG: tyrosine-type recombinase/integrase [Eubacteriales bacterium]|nr:tyrosine-type recombinase/integrase [Eubacteriales bacterium]
MEVKKRNARGEGSFKKNPDGTITHRKGVGYKPNGKRKTLTVTAATKTACIKAMKKLEAEWNAKKSETMIDGKDTVYDLCYRHLKYQISNGDLKHKSIDRRECTIENQIKGYDVGYFQCRSVTSVDIEQHVKHLIAEGKVGASSIIKTVDVLNAAYAWAVRCGDLTNNPVVPVKAELVKKISKISGKGANDADVSVLSEEELRRFKMEALSFAENGKRKYSAGLYCLLLVNTGMRVGEMIALRWSDWKGDVLVIDKSISVAKNRDKVREEDNHYVSIEGTTKNQKARIIQLTVEAKSILEQIKSEAVHYAPDNFITPTKTGRVNTASNLEHRLKTILKNTGIEDVEGGLHILRKTFATQMYENGARVEEIAAYIGDLESTTRKYYIAIRRKMLADGEFRQVVKLPVKP